MHLSVVALARKRKVTKMMQGLFSPFSFHAVSCCFFFVLGAQSARVALGPCIEHRGIVTEFSSSDSSVVSDDDFAWFMILKAGKWLQMMPLNDGSLLIAVDMMRRWKWPGAQKGARSRRMEFVQGRGHAPKISEDWRVPMIKKGSGVPMAPRLGWWKCSKEH